MRVLNSASGRSVPRIGESDEMVEHIGQTEGEFSVCQFFADESYEYVRRFVGAEEAVEAFGHYTQNVTAQLGVVKRVIITDGLDSINMEWKFGEGITYPPEAVGKVYAPERKESNG